MANGNNNNGRQPPDKGAKVNQPQRPVHEVRLGRVKAAIWHSTGQYRMRFTVKVSKIYKADDDAGGEGKWQSTDVFVADDLLLLAKVLDLAHTWIHEKGSAEDIPY